MWRGTLLWCYRSSCSIASWSAGPTLHAKLQLSAWTKFSSRLRQSACLAMKTCGLWQMQSIIIRHSWWWRNENLTKKLNVAQQAGKGNTVYRPIYTVIERKWTCAYTNTCILRIMMYNVFINVGQLLSLYLYARMIMKSAFAFWFPFGLNQNGL